jgi:hypothetical protein
MGRGCILTGFFLLGFGHCAQSHAQIKHTGTCAAFAPDGALATGTLKESDLETRLSEPGVPAVTTHTPVTYLGRCEETFSDDSKWLATVVPGNELTVIIHDRKTGTMHRKFSSQWERFGSSRLEWAYKSPFAAGFLPDDSLALWRYVPQAASDPTDASHVDLHMQRWSVEGELLSDQNLGALGFGLDGRRPIAANGPRLLWLPTQQGGSYREVKISDAQIEDVGMLTLPANSVIGPAFLPGASELLTVTGKREVQKVVVLDSAGHPEKQVRLPFFPNLFGPLVPDWFGVQQLKISHDGEFAAISRTRVAWVLVDTDRDWGSEIALVKTHPLAISTVLKTGKGGIGVVVVDHRNGVVRLVGFWKGRWHDLQYDERHPVNGQIGNRRVISRGNLGDKIATVREFLPPHHPYQYRDTNHNPVNGKWRKASAAHPVHKPRHHHQRHDKRNHKANQQDDPFMPVNRHAAQRFLPMLGVKSFE